MKWLMFAWKNVMRNRRRSLTAMLITALGTAAVLASGGFALFTYESLEEMTARDTGHVVAAHARGFDGDEDMPLQHGLADSAALAAKFAALPEVRAVASRAQFSGLISNGDKSAVFVGSGVVPEIDFRLRGPQMNFIAGQPPVSNAPQPEVVIGNELARLMKARVGSSLTLLATTTEGNLNAVDVVVSGIASVGVPEIDKRLVLADLASVQKLLLSDKVGTLSIYLKETADTEAIAARVREMQPGLAVKTWRDLAVFYQAVRALYNRIFGILGVIMICIVLFAMSNTLGMAVVERTREIGTLRAIGLRRGGVVGLFIGEAALLVLLGCIAGLLLTIGVRYGINLADISYVPPNQTAPVPLLVDLDTPRIMFTALMMAAVGAFAAWMPARRAAKQPIIDALGHV